MDRNALAPVPNREDRPEQPILSNLIDRESDNIECRGDSARGRSSSGVCVSARPGRAAAVGRRGWMLGLIFAVVALGMLGVQASSLAAPPQSPSPAIPAPRIVQRQQSERQLGSRPGALPEALPAQAGMPPSIQPPLTSDEDQKLGAPLIPGQVIEPIDLAG